jgi:hypothetical protein
MPYGVIAEGEIVVGRSKTEAGTARVVPLTGRRTESARRDLTKQLIQAVCSFSHESAQQTISFPNNRLMKSLRSPASLKLHSSVQDAIQSHLEPLISDYCSIANSLYPLHSWPPISGVFSPR